MRVGEDGVSSTSKQVEHAPLWKKQKVTDDILRHLNILPTMLLNSTKRKFQCNVMVWNSG